MSWSPPEPPEQEEEESEQPPPVNEPSIEEDIAVFVRVVCDARMSGATREDIEAELMVDSGLSAADAQTVVTGAISIGCPELG